MALAPLSNMAMADPLFCFFLILVLGMKVSK